MVPSSDDKKFFEWVGGINEGIKNINKILEDGKTTFLAHSENQNRQFRSDEKRFDDIEKKLEKKLNGFKLHLYYFHLAVFGVYGWVGYLTKKIFELHSK